MTCIIAYHFSAYVNARPAYFQFHNAIWASFNLSIWCFVKVLVYNHWTYSSLETTLYEHCLTISRLGSVEDLHPSLFPDTFKFCCSSIWSLLQFYFANNVCSFALMKYTFCSAFLSSSLITHRSLFHFHGTQRKNCQDICKC